MLLCKLLSRKHEKQNKSIHVELSTAVRSLFASRCVSLLVILRCCFEKVIHALISSRLFMFDSFYLTIRLSRIAAKCWSWYLEPHMQAGPHFTPPGLFVLAWSCYLTFCFQKIIEVSWPDALLYLQVNSGTACSTHLTPTLHGGSVVTPLLHSRRSWD